MLSQRRSRPLANLDKLHTAKKMTTRSLPEIEEDLLTVITTVIHAVKTITRLSEQDDDEKKYTDQEFIIRTVTKCNLLLKEIFY